MLLGLWSISKFLKEFEEGVLLLLFLYSGYLDVNVGGPLYRMATRGSHNLAPIISEKWIDLIYEI